MDPFESRLKSLPLLKPSEGFGEPETFAAATSSAKQSQSLFERVSNMPWTLKSAGVVGFAASLVAVYVALSGVGGSGVAFAQVIEQLSKAETVAYDVATIRDSDGKVVYSGKDYFLAPGKHRHESKGAPDGDGYVVTDSVAGRAVFVDSQQKTVRISSLTELPERDRASERIREIRSLRLEDAESIGSKQVDGVPANGYRFKKKHATTTLWATATGKLLRLEHKLNKSSDDALTVVWTNIKLDEPLDASLFSLATPQGYTESTFVPIDMNASPATWVAGFLRLYAKHSSGAYPAEINKIQAIAQKLASQGIGENEKAALAFYAAAIQAIVNRTEQGTDWEYFPQVRPSQKSDVLFWLKNRGSDGYTAVLGDLSVKEVAESQLPSN